ncbi:MAG TPA: sulfotransferase [Gaiella sp.]
MDAPPLIVLGVRRSGTTLLRVMLDRSSVLAIPDESYFVPQLAHRHRGRVDPDSFLEDVRRLPTIREWGLDAGDVEERLRPGMTTGEAIGALFAAYAGRQGKERWGDKTPLYMQYLPLLESLFRTARYVHLVRDGRDAALSYLAVPAGIMTAGWGHPRDAAAFACLWRSEIEDARALGRRVGDRYLQLAYEELVAEPERTLGRVCSFAELPYEAAMLDYVGRSESARKPHQQRLNEPPTPNVRDWRHEMPAADRRAFEEVAGDLLAELGYDVEGGGTPPGPGARLRLARYRSLAAAWRAAGWATQRSPLWRRRHPRLL